MRTTITALLIVISFFSGASVNNTPPTVLTQTVTRYIYDAVGGESPLIGIQAGVDESVVFWKQEVARRFPTAFLYAIHGTTLNGEWVCQTPDLEGFRPVRELALELKERFPDRIIVLIVCNPDGLDLGIPGVYHARSNVWFVPDKFREDGYPVEYDPKREYVGNIYEFDDK